jgi:hypothetical protein
MGASNRVRLALLALLLPALSGACSRAATARDAAVVPLRAEPPATVVAPDPVAAVRPSAVAYTGPPGAYRVAFVGDSMLDVSALAVVAAAQEHYRVALIARGSWTVAKLHRVVRKVLHDPAGPPDALVVFEGTDDMFEHNTNVGRDIVRENGAVRAAGVRCFVRTTISAYTTTFYRGHPYDRVINNLYAWSAAATPGWFVVDWDRAAGNTRGLYAWDLIHPTAIAAQWLAHEYVTTLEQRCGLTPASARAVPRVVQLQ